MSEESYTVPTMAEMAAKNESPEILFWVGCAGSLLQDEIDDTNRDIAAQAEAQLRQRRGGARPS